ncbi:SDR family NAD(P)-dependent oxidoreductase, partial [Mycobacteroides abscessus]|uniref:SDR family NAD(P)-dependent oxidoreductase n=1 Tax=Mycobacteroides abscessus TaxID=36809 RepID=UPI003CE7A8D5
MTQPLLADKVAVVTGAAQGIGREIARVLHGHGARVVLADLDGGAAQQAACRGRHPPSLHYRGWVM